MVDLFSAAGVEVVPGVPSMATEANNLRRAINWLEAFDDEDVWDLYAEVRRNVLPFVPQRLRVGYEAMVERLAECDGMVLRAPRKADLQSFWPEEILEEWCKRRLRTLERRMMVR